MLLGGVLLVGFVGVVSSFFWFVGLGQGCLFGLCWVLVFLALFGVLPRLLTAFCLSSYLVSSNVGRFLGTSYGRFLGTRV